MTGCSSSIIALTCAPSHCPRHRRAVQRSRSVRCPHFVVILNLAVAFTVLTSGCDPVTSLGVLTVLSELSATKPEPESAQEDKTRGSDLFESIADAPTTNGDGLLKAIKAVRLIVRISQPSDDMSESAARRAARKALSDLGVKIDDEASATLLLDITARGITHTVGSNSSTGMALHCQSRLLLPTFYFAGDRVWFGTTSPFSACIKESVYGGIHADWAKSLARRATKAVFQRGSDVSLGNKMTLPSAQTFETGLAQALQSDHGPLAPNTGFDILFDRTIAPPAGVLIRYDSMYSEQSATNDFIRYLRSNGLRRTGTSTPHARVFFHLHYDAVEYETFLGLQARPELCAVFESVSVRVPNVCVASAAGEFHWIGSTELLSKTASSVISARLPTVTDEVRRLNTRAGKVARDIASLQE